MKVLAVKYWVVFLTKIKNLLEYRTNILLKLIRPLIMTAAVGSLWLVLFEFNDQKPIGGFTRQSFIMYLLVIRFIAVFSPGGASIAEMNEEITTGNFTMRLVRPLHYLVWLFFRNLPIPLVSGCFGLVLITIIAKIFNAVTPTGPHAWLFVASVLATILVQYAIYQGIGILSFWIYEIHSIERLYKITSSMLSGELVPLSLFGPVAQSVLQVLPFATLAFIPGGIYIGFFNADEAARLVAVQFTWVFILWTLVIWIYNKGLKRFEAQGG